MHILTLLQISCGDIEMAKQRLGQARNILNLENMFFYHALPTSNLKHLNYHNHEHFEEKPPKSEWYICPPIPQSRPTCHMSEILFHETDQ